MGALGAAETPDASAQDDRNLYNHVCGLAHVSHRAVAVDAREAQHTREDRTAGMAPEALDPTHDPVLGANNIRSVQCTHMAHCNGGCFQLGIVSHRIRMHKELRSEEIVASGEVLALLVQAIEQGSMLEMAPGVQRELLRQPVLALGDEASQEEAELQHRGHDMMTVMELRCDGASA